MHASRNLWHEHNSLIAEATDQRRNRQTMRSILQGAMTGTVQSGSSSGRSRVARRGMVNKKRQHRSKSHTEVSIITWKVKKKNTDLNMIFNDILVIASNTQDKKLEHEVTLAQ
jgi:hypothetical protein